jgi:hypothetical protein
MTVFFFFDGILSSEFSNTAQHYLSSGFYVQKFLRFLNLMNCAGIKSTLYLANTDKMEYGVGVTSDLTLRTVGYNLFFTKVGAAFTIDCRPNATAGATAAAPASPLYTPMYAILVTHH